MKIKICPQCGRQMTDEVFKEWWFCEPCFIRIAKKYDSLDKSPWENEFDRMTLYARIQVGEAWREWFDTYNNRIKDFIKVLLLNQDIKNRK